MCIITQLVLSMCFLAAIYGSYKMKGNSGAAKAMGVTGNEAILSN